MGQKEKKPQGDLNIIDQQYIKLGRKMSKTATISVILLCLSISSGFTQSEILTNYHKPVIQDVRAKALGGAAILGSTGGASMFSNPANMASIGGVDLSISTGTSFVKEEHDKDGIHYDMRDLSTDYSFPIAINSFSVAVPLYNEGTDKSVVFALGYKTGYDAKFNYTGTYEIEDVSFFEARYADGVYEADYKGSVDYLTSAMSFKIDNIQIGIAFNKTVQSSIEIIQEQIDKDYYMRVEDRVQRRNLDYQIEDDFLLFGLRYVHENFDLGVTYKTENKINFDDVEISEQYDALIQDYDKYSTSYTFPYTVGIAMGYNLLPNLKIIDEVQTRRLGDLKAEDSQKSYENKYAHFIGLEYVPVKQLALRLGAASDYYYFPEFYDYDRAPVHFYLQRVHKLTAGFGLVFYPLKLDVALEYFSFKSNVDSGFYAMWGNNYKFTDIDMSLTFFLN